MARKTLSGAIANRIGVSDSIDDAYDAMFGLSRYHEADKIIELELSLLYPHPKDPFKPYSDEKLKELAENIRVCGLLEPVIVRPAGASNGTYEILSGKNRTNAERLNGQKTIQAIIREVDDSTALLIITDANLKHRETLLPSEKGWAYRLQLEATTEQGKRRDLAENSTSVQNEPKWSRTIVAENNSVKDSEIQRYIRLTYLLPSLLDGVDNKQIPVMAGVELSYLSEASQTAVINYLLATDFKNKISVKMAANIRSVYEKNNTLTLDQVHDLVDGKEKPQVSKTFTIKRTKLKQFSSVLPDDKELERLFIEFLTQRFCSPSSS